MKSKHSRSGTSFGCWQRLTVWWVKQLRYSSWQEGTVCEMQAREKDQRASSGCGAGKASDVEDEGDAHSLK